MGLDCTRAEAARIERFLGGSPDAGMTDAIRWAKSSDPSDREFAADLFADIGTPAAISALRALSHDSDPEVAKHAAIELVEAAKGPVRYTVEKVPIAN